ncbi:Protein ZINC INDUCED FACILITATOR-LIKE 1 [Triticum urartu]|uniref:Protein ZINC INDUCED FACILITATOR-LIKE 1 n=1 Tax=Triticum urartu TaxID=4572 RepID=M7Z9W7_TRIUA|nr:Protein ZINC INDUCED FACILITATOR-LIKE 1 [Triticum urartu]
MTGSGREAPLLRVRKVYHERCPGCRQERKTQADHRIPYTEFLYIWIACLCAALPIQSLFPYLYFMIRDLEVAKQEQDIGFYAGFVGAAYFLGRTISAVPWGIFADKYGRKPCIVISILSVIVFNTLFGLSTTYWMAIVTRGLLGLLCGILGPIKAYASEVCRKEHQALGISLVTSSRAIALVIGPAIGGFLAQKDKGCSARREDTTQLDLPNPNKEQQTRTNKVTNIARAKTGDNASKQDGAFKKEYDAETPSPSGPEEPGLGFPLSSKRGATEGLDNASKEETTSADAVVASIGKPSRDFSLA